MSGAIFGGDDVGAVVIDVGTLTTKVGLAGAENPSGVYPTAIGHAKLNSKDENAMDASADSKAANVRHIVGDNPLSFPRADCEVKSPLVNGLVEDWDAFEALLQYGFTQSLHCEPSEKCVLMSQPTWVTKHQTEKLSELLFEKFNVKALHFVKSPVLSCFANGRGTGLVVDCGAEETRVTPVYDGTALLTAARRTQCAGNYLTRQFRHILEKKMGVELVPANKIASKSAVPENAVPIWSPRPTYPKVTDSYANWGKERLVRDLQQCILRVCEKRFVESELTNIPTTPYEFPNGYNSNWGLERYSVAEGLFHPDHYRVATKPAAAGSSIDPLAADTLMGQGPPTPAVKELGIQNAINQSIFACDPEIRQQMWSNVILCGGTSLHQGLHERIATELGMMLPRGSKYKINAAPSMQDRLFSAWIGGSIYASLGTFQQLWVAKEAYLDDKSIVEKRCP